LEGGRRDERVALAMLGTVVVLWGTAYWPTEVAAGETPTLMLAALRTIPTALVLLAAVPLLGDRLPTGRLLAWAVLTGLTGITLFQWGGTEAIARAGPGNAAVLLNTPPLWVLVLAWVFLRERAPRTAVAGLAIGFVGVVLMVANQLGGTGDATDLAIGMGLALAAAIGWAVTTILVKRLSMGPVAVDMVGFTALHYVVATIVLVPTAFAIEGTDGTDWGSAALWVPLVWIGPVNGLGVLLFFLALRHVSAARASAFLFLIPALAVVVEMARGNVPGAIVLVGMVLAIAGVALVNVPPGRLGKAFARGKGLPETRSP
jgi:drug/metabolite transporter (DMT)-like permease